MEATILYNYFCIGFKAKKIISKGQIINKRTKKNFFFLNQHYVHLMSAIVAKHFAAAVKDIVKLILLILIFI